MPWSDHPSCQAPETESQTLWRYMDLWKFVDLLQSRSLYFSRLDRLDDPWEGYLPTATVEILRKALEDPNTTDVTRWNVPRIMQMFEDARIRLLVSCWHMSDTESAGMWKIYSASGQGICLKATYKSMREAFANEERAIMGGVVRYVDYDVTQIRWDNMLNVAVHKRRPFRSEEEFRAIYLNPGAELDGLRINLDLPLLLQEVIMAPGSTGWCQSVVEGLLVLSETRCADQTVRRSELDAPRPY